MRVLLVAPPRLPGLKDSTGSIPTSLLYLASALRQAGHYPALCDLSVVQGLTTDDRGGIPEALARSLDREKPELLGMNCLTSLHFPYVNHLAAALRDALPGVPIALGGAHASLFPAEILENCPCIDFVVAGEGEEPLVAIANELCRCEAERDPTALESVAYRSRGSIALRPGQPQSRDLDPLADPAWDLVSLSDYQADHSQWNNPKKLPIGLSAPIASSRGCPFSCSFCAAHKTMGRTLRLRSASRVVDEMQMLNERHGQTYFSFIDDNMNVDRRHVLAICAEICRRGLDIQFETLSGLHVGTLDEEVVDALDRAGCVFARLAIEHGNDRIRNKVIGKSLDRETIYRVCAAFAGRRHIRTAGLFVMGFPEDTCATLEETRQMILDLELDFNYVFNLLPFPGTAVFEQAARDGLLLNGFDRDRLWSGEVSLDLTRGDSPFFVKPYAMTLEELHSFRRAFDDLRVCERLKRGTS